MTKLTRLAVEGCGLSQKEADRCRNFFAMGLVFWLYDRSLDPTLRFIEKKFGNKPAVAEANTKALKAGYNYGETVEAINTQYQVVARQAAAGTYRNIMGNTALAWGLIAAAHLSKKRLFLGAYPITPASDILHELAKHKNFDVLTFQAEDEIAAMTSTIGAAFAGAMAVTASSGPGIALKGEAYGPGRDDRTADDDHQRPARRPVDRACPPRPNRPTCCRRCLVATANARMPVIAARSPAIALTSPRRRGGFAVRFMTPVMLLTDGYIANGTEPWRIPDVGRPAEDSSRAPQRAEQRRSVSALRAQRAARPSLGDPRHTWAGAPHRRSGETRRHRQCQLRPGQSRAHVQTAC